MDLKSLYEKWKFRLMLCFPEYTNESIKYEGEYDYIFAHNVTFGNMPYKKGWVKDYTSTDPMFRKSIKWFPSTNYSDKNVTVLDGTINIHCPSDGMTEGAMVSNFTFKYGTVRALIKAPNVKGVWSAFWLFDENGMPEHDFEFCGQEKHTVNVTHHWGITYDDNNKKSTLHNARRNKNFNPTTEYNMYEIEKLPYKVTYKINGVVVKVMRKGISSGNSRLLFTAGTGIYCGSEKNQPLNKNGIMSIKSIELYKLI